MRIVYDIETIPQPVEQRKWATPTYETMKWGNLKDETKRQAWLTEAIEAWDEGPDCALHAELGRVALIGFALLDDPVQIIEDEDEAKMIKEFWQSCGRCSPGDRIVGFCSSTFDLPFLIRRSFLLQIPVPRTLHAEATMPRPTIPVDLMRVWQLGDRQKYITLDRLARAFGLSVPESGVDSAEFYKFWATDKPACREHVRHHVALTRELAERMGA